MAKKLLALAGIAALLAVAIFVSDRRRLFEPAGGPLVEMAGFRQPEAEILTCTPIGESGQAQLMVTSMHFGPEHPVPPGFTFTGVEVKASQYVTEYESVLIRGAENVPWWVTPLPEGEIPPGYWADPLPTAYQSDTYAGIGILVTVDLNGVDNPEEPVVELTGFSYTSADGSSYSVPMRRKAWLTTLDVNEDGYCSAFP